uniref:Retrotransposon gag domain-containing protein n=1 Tax=Periophthalmus magnuspinnatus TaxID=409849 RepID=A0A3B4A8J4_9GOBI
SGNKAKHFNIPARLWSATPTITTERNQVLCHAFSHHEVIIGQHDQSLRTLLDYNQTLTQQVSQLTGQVAALLAASPPTPPPAAAAVGTAPLPHSPESRGTDPDPYSGQPGLFQGFLFQCTFLFQQCPARFDSDAAKIRYICGLLRGRVLQWAEARLSNTAFKLVFDHPHYQADAAARLLSLAQRRRPVADYAIEFWTLAVEVDWTDSALRAAFLKGLNEHLKDEFFLISLAHRIDNRLQTRQRERRRSPVPRETRVFQLPPEEPMQLGRASVSPEECSQRRRRAGECLYCGERGHFIAVCSVRPKGGAHQ